MVRAIALVLFLSACTHTEVLPVFTRVPPPKELMTSIAPPYGEPVFVSPDNEGVVVGMTEEGKNRLVLYIDELSKRLEAWRAWGAE